MTLPEKWAIAASIATILYTGLTFILLMQNKKINSTNNKLAEFQIYNEIAKKITTPEVSQLIRNILNNNFNLDENNTIVLKEHLLDNFEDLALFYEDGLVEISKINSGFGAKILVLGNCTLVREFISQTRNQESDELYKGFETLYNKIYEISNPNERLGRLPRLFN